MMFIRKPVILLVFSFIATLSYSQHLTYTMYEILSKEDKKSSPTALENKYDGIIGSAFLTEGWTTGRAFTSMKAYTKLKLKFDTYTNTIYLNINDTVHDITKSGIIQFDIFPDASDTSNVMSFNNGYSIEEIKPEMFVNVMAEGKITFIKYFKKEIEEVYESSPSYKEKKFLEKHKYFIIQNGTGREVIINKKSLEKLLSDKWDLINKYAKDKNISAASEQGWKQLISYYNSL